MSIILACKEYDHLFIQNTKRLKHRELLFFVMKLTKDRKYFFQLTIFLFNDKTHTRT